MFLRKRYSHFRASMHLVKTLWLFTADDLFSILIPNVVCSLAIVSSGHPFKSPISQVQLLGRIHLVVAWVWFNLLFFNVSNQTQDESIEEDRENKPWRPLPAQRITQQQARILYAILGPIVLSMSTFTGGLIPSICLQILTFAYNDLRFGDKWYFRNCINAGGYVSFILGAIQAALGAFSLEYSPLAIRWLLIIVSAVTTGIHAMDLYDQAGDCKRGRRTVPIVIGDSTARKTVVASVCSISLSAPKLIRVSFMSSIPANALAVWIACRLIWTKRPSVLDDKFTFKIWCLWLISLYLIPVLDKFITCYC